MDHRRGRGQIRTADELQALLAVPLYYILEGSAQAAFPGSSTPAPSPFVQVVRVGRIHPQHTAAFPVYVNWRQWNELVVPVLSNDKWAKGSLMFVGGMYEKIALIGKDLWGRAVADGYGSPDQEFPESC